ncbi:endonuclease/exonuclease/phosphatase family protein [Streptomyces kronopolitis]|uniref:endonuclease/exonuclease/phosphatase family protein n=1 Tax=Streptomyces kronopolitis TaxID=1612435 RepID=UPI0034489574
MVNYNTMLLSTWMTLDNSQFNNSARVQAMLDNGFLDDKDVIVLEELFHIDASKKLLNGLYDKGYRYQTRVVGASKWEGTRGRDWDGEHLNGGGLENGGVAIVSRHPIEVSEQQVFAKGCAADKHAQKGFAYARINKGGHLFHVAGTHPQATDSGCGSRKDAAEVRASQFKEIDQFFTRKERDNEIASTEPALIVGDLNVDRDTPEYVDMLRLLQASDGRRAGERHSFDTQNNELAKIRYPDDQPEDLDFALQRRGHPPVDDWSYEVTRPRSTSPLVVEGRTGPGGIFVKDQVRDLSDHYALTASGTMPARSAKSWRLRIDRITMTKGDEQNDSGDDLYGDVTVNGTYLWSVARGNSLNNKKFPYDLPSVSHQYLMSDEGFTIHVHIVDNDTIGDDELVDASERWNPVGNSPGTHTVTLTGRYGAADLTYTVEHT